MNFHYDYNLSGTARKPLVAAVSRILGQAAVYQGAPSFAYAIGGCTVDRNGVLSLPGDTAPDAIEKLIGALREQGFMAENATEETVSGSNTCGESPDEETANAKIVNAFTIEIPGTRFTPEALENLRKIIASKETLLRQALGADSLPVIETEGMIAFPWFTLHGLDGEADAYSQLIAAMCKMAKEQKRVTATGKPVENIKFAMRLFLVRLGFIGDEYKTARKILLRNLTGNSSWKAGYKPEQRAGDAGSVESTESAVPTDQGTAMSPGNKGGAPYNE